MKANAPLPPKSILREAVQQRDSSWVGTFIFGVTTTGVACKPGCPSRLPLEQHIRFFPDLESAIGEGFRPCQRCRPELVSAVPEWWTAAVELAETTERGVVSDSELRSQGLDPVRLRRRSLRQHGMTFHRWCRTRTIAQAQRQLSGGNSVDQVIIKSGYSSHSGFRAAFAKITGGSPGKRRNDEPVSVQIADSPVGKVVIGAVTRGICLLEFAEPERLKRQANSLSKHFGGPMVEEHHPLLDQLIAELDQYWQGKRKNFEVPIDVRGSDFELATWTALRSIPWGQTRSYQELAAMVGKQRAVRAVGSANGRNRISILIPCHRVIRSTGELGGYGGGLWRKQRLLETEGLSVADGTLLKD